VYTGNRIVGSNPTPSANTPQLTGSSTDRGGENREEWRDSGDKAVDFADGVDCPLGLSRAFFLQSSELLGIGTDPNIVIDQRLGRTLRSRSWEARRLCK
jgi:hypothetical protein